MENPMFYVKNLRESYSPLLFLASLGSGGLVISFFMYLLYMIPHKGSPIPAFEHIAKAWSGGDPFHMAIIAISLAGVAFFTFQHLRLLVWNYREYLAFRKTAAFEKMRNSNAEVQLMAIPLTLAMFVNVMFIVGAVFAPGLWGVRELLFPFALAAFAVIGVYAIRIFLEFFSRVLATGNFDCEQNNSLSQMLSIFAFSMIAVGFSAAGAMSHSKVVSATGIILATAFAAFALLLAVIKIVLGFRSMFGHGVNREASVSLWIVIPILTVLGIAFFRISMGLHHNFGVHNHPMNHVLLFTVLISIQIFFGLLGHAVMKRIGYYETFISGEGKSAVAYAAICPGVALFVMGNFLINMGLARAGLLAKFSPVYFAFYAPLALLQVKTILTLFKLNGKLLMREGGNGGQAAVAE
jgi:hypothetical protein